MEEDQMKLRRQLRVVNKILINNAKWYIPTIVMGSTMAIILNWDKIKNA